MVQFTERDQKEAEKVISRWFPHQKHSILLNGHLEELKNDLAFGNRGGISRLFHSLRTDFREFGITRRIVTGDVDSMLASLQTSARFGYFLRLTGGEGYSGGNDCLHVFDLMNMFAAGDMKAVDSLANRFPAPFKKGHPETVTLCNAVYACLGRHPDPDSITTKLEKKKGTKFFVAMHQCLWAILKQDWQHFSLHLDLLLKGNRRQDFHSSMQKIICLEAHGLSRIWMFRHGSALPGFSALELPWDKELYHHALGGTEPPLHDFSDVSPVVDQWLRVLPDQVAEEDLFNELKESLIRRMVRRIRVVRQRNSPLNSGSRKEK